jgi:hypothetical protein
MLKEVLGKLGDSGPPLAIRKELRDVAPDLKSYYARLEKSTGVSGWQMEIEVRQLLHASKLLTLLLQDVVAFADAYPALSPNKLIKELLSVHDSIMRYFTDRAEDVLKDEMMKEAFVGATSSKKIVLKLSERVNASGRGIGVSFANGECEVLQQVGTELGSGKVTFFLLLSCLLICSILGKAYLDDMIKDTLGKLGDSGPPLAIRKELRDVEPDLKSYYARLEKSTGVSGWQIVIEVCFLVPFT